MLSMKTTQHILVVANETATGETLHRTVRALAADPAARVHVVVPSPEPAASADWRLQWCLEQLGELELDVAGHVGAADPMRAIADALDSFPATELVISTRPPAQSSWLAADLVDRALARFGLPTVHIVDFAAAQPVAA
jgi:GABA permease